MSREAEWQVRAAAWELLALSLRYPDEVLAEAIASGEWEAAAAEIAEALGIGEGEEGDALDAAPAPGPAPASTAPAPTIASASPAPASAKHRAGARATADAMNRAAPPARPASGAAASPALLRPLRVEATRLFVGAPEPAVSPYEGVARALAEGARPLLFVNPRSMDVERFVRSCGLGRPEGANEPLDHVAAECELLSYLASLAAGAPAPAGAPCGAALPGGSPQAAYAAFLDAHARRWMPAFAAAVRAEARAPFYGAAARLLAAVVERG